MHVTTTHADYARYLGIDANTNDGLQARILGELVTYLCELDLFDCLIDIRITSPRPDAENGSIGLRITTERDNPFLGGD